MGLEVALGILGVIITALSGGVAGAFALQGKNREREESIRVASEARFNRLIDTNKQQMDLVLDHVRKVETTLNDMRAELPTRYTLKEDHLRLVEKVEELTLLVWRRKDSEPPSN